MKTKKSKKTIINIFLIGAILGILTCIILEKMGDNSIKENDNSIGILRIGQEMSNTTNKEVDNTLAEKQYPKEEILDTYKGYPVCAKLEIPSISLEANILSHYSKKALKVSATKFWGVEPNQNGNFCIAGHNTKSMFSGIKQLKIGDTLYITDKKVGKVKYEIFNTDKVSPQNVDCLDPLTNGEKEVTLITCTNDSKKRVIIKAKEIL